MSIAAKHILALALFAAPALHAQTTAHGNELTHIVHFQTGDTYFQPGDDITITEVRGTSDTISAGNLYEVKGTYKLASQPDASLSASVTTNSQRPTYGMKVNDTPVDKGEGQFTVYFYMSSDGWPHLSFYPTHGGNSFAGIYFGTGDSIMRSHHPH